MELREFAALAKKRVTALNIRGERGQLSALKEWR
jgi:hypothetical protein